VVRRHPVEPWESRAEFECWRCHEKWSGVSGPTACPACRWIYLTWVNHPLEIERNRK